jgi:hypothetical protein
LYPADKLGLARADEGVIGMAKRPKKTGNRNKSVTKDAVRPENDSEIEKMIADAQHDQVDIKAAKYDIQNATRTILLRTSAMRKTAQITPRVQSQGQVDYPW